MAVEIQNPSDRQGAARVVDIGPLPDDPGANASYVLSYTGDVLDYVEVTRHGLTWRKTLTWTGSNLTAVSAWVLQ